jgi:uncharacterized protein
MGLKEQIDNDIKTAMKARDQAALRALRAIKAAILLVETSENRPDGSLTPEEETALLVKQAKQRKDSITQFSANNRPDLAEGEAEELAIIERYLPKPLTGEELEAAVIQAIAEVAAASPQDMGKVMKALGATYGSRVDNKVASEIIKQRLASA